MALLHAAILSLLLLGISGEHFKIPEIENVVAYSLSKNTKYVHFHGNYSHAADVSKRQSTPYWYEEINHQGISAFGPGGYQVYRNVKSYGAKGDGITDDTAAINAAISADGRCGQGCATTTTTPAVVYFPSGTYLISSSIIDYYYTQLIGNPNDPPVLKATANFTGFGLIDGDPYYTSTLNWESTDVFYRQVRNFVLDTTNIPSGSAATGIHWPTAQATSLQNVVFQMSAATGTQHIGLFCESGSAGFMTDLTFNGGLIGAQVGSQQFTMRNLVFNNCVTAISQIWSWGWLYQGISINNCQTGIDISAGGSGAQGVGSVIFIDSSITNTPVGVITAFDSTSLPATAGSLILENVALDNVSTVVKLFGGGTLLTGTSGLTTISAWGEGNEYTPSGPRRFQGPFTPNSRPGSLVNGSSYYVRSKPQYSTLPVSSFQSVRSAGARGNGVIDDTTALQNIINSATAAGQIVFFDAGTYLITQTLLIPPGAKLVGEGYPVIMSSGSFFSNMSNPKPVVKVGNAGSAGQVEWSDMIVSTQGTQPGAVLIEWNLATSGTPSGIWDVHARVGGFLGSNLQVAQCPAAPGSENVNTACIGAYMTMHVTPSASGLYMENVWLWTADHDIDDPGNTQLDIFNGRGLYIESIAGTFWLIGTAVEHHTLYQYQLTNTKNLFMGFIQTETPYYQPNPAAPIPFNVVPSLNDPDFATSCVGKSGNCANAWGLRIVNSQNVLIYGAGHYSFFDNYSTSCSNGGGPENCQDNIVSLEGSLLSHINIYCLSTVGTTNMITENGATLAIYSDNVNVYPDTIALFQIALGSGGTFPSPPTSTKVSKTSVPTTLSTRISSPSPASSSRPASPGWNFRGCYTDSVAARSLGIAISVPGAMTIELCQIGCLDLGYSLAGVEYSVECYCDDTLRNGGVPALDGSAQCDMACSGNNAEMCGGPNRLDLYSYDVGNRTTVSTVMLTTMSSSLPTEPASSIWEFRGCYTDNVAARSLSHAVEIPGGASAMTIEACQSTCHSLGYLLAGVEYSDECYCDNTLQNGGETAPDGNAQCHMTCAGNGVETCGGPNRLSLYMFGSGNGTGEVP